MGSQAKGIVERTVSRALQALADRAEKAEQQSALRAAAKVAELWRRLGRPTADLEQIGEEYRREARYQVGRIMDDDLWEREPEGAPDDVQTTWWEVH